MPVLSRSTFPAFLSALLIALASCSSSSVVSTTHAPAVLGCRITFGESGGFTGGGTGYTIDTTGVVSRFKGIMISAAPKTIIGRLTPAQIASLNTLIAQLPHTDYSERGNLTTYLVLGMGNSETKFSWPGTSPGPRVPEPVTRLYSELTSIVGSL
jgi:hypothetical protein